METKIRSWSKSITWRIIGIAILPLIMLFVNICIGTDIATMAIWTTVIFHAIRIILYYFHERIWLKIKWGTILISPETPEK